MKLAQKAQKLAQAFAVTDGKSFRLQDFDPGDRQGLHAKKKAAHLLQKSMSTLCELQEKLYASEQWSLLIVIQAMDAAGKDSLIKHVMSGVNPQGCEVTSFKQPSSEELDHDFLWRAVCHLPRRGRIGVFNRSYYEEVLVVRVHRELLAGQRLPAQLVTKEIWQERFEDIRNFEKHLSRNGTIILKFFLNLSKEEQRSRFLDRLEQPEKNWKFSEGDVLERKSWSDYMQAYEEMIRSTATPEAPWYVVPADHKWLTHLAVSAAIIGALEKLDLEYPKVAKEREQSLQAARLALTSSPG